MRGFPAFAVCFTLLIVIWREHYVFFRRYGLQDATTLWLNAALLFVMLFYVYPLKFVFTLVLAPLTGRRWRCQAGGGTEPVDRAIADAAPLPDLRRGGHRLVRAPRASLRARLPARGELALTPVERSTRARASARTCSPPEWRPSRSSSR